MLGSEGEGGSRQQCKVQLVGGGDGEVGMKQDKNYEKNHLNLVT